VLDINGGTFTSLDTNGPGIQIGGVYAGESGLFLIRAGTASVNQITFGDLATQTSGTDALSLTGGALYLGAGGIIITNPAPAFGTSITMSGGTIGASADWSSSLPITLTTNITTFKAADIANVAHNITLGGVLSGAGGLTKTGNGTLLLSGVNTYTNNTTVNAGMLELVQPSLFTNSTVAVAGGATLKLDFATTNAVAGLILNGVNKPAGVYNNGNSPTFIAGTGSLLVVPTTSLVPTNILFTVSGNTLTLSWPADHLGWQLQMQTNSLATGLGTNWVTLPGSESVTSTNFVVNPVNGSVFYRMIHP
jgi:autotransporter-associated beta strand protein